MNSKSKGAKFAAGSRPKVILRARQAERVVAGHPWVYERGIRKVEGEPEDGGEVDVLDLRGRFLGVGLFNSRSQLRVRVMNHRNAPVDRALFRQRFRKAAALRERIYPGQKTCRLVHAEADFFSGLIVDRYEDVLVVQISALGLEQRKEALVGAMESVWKPAAIVERGDLASRRLEGLAASTGVLRGECPERVGFELNGLRLMATPLAGHKTGFYLDQRENYRLVEAWLRGRPGAVVLDAFCSTGAFALHAARAGAARVLGIDQSEEALALAREHAVMNGLEDRCAFEAGNVFDRLKAMTEQSKVDQQGPAYDAVILDPPSFTRSRETVVNALRGYKEIHVRALKLLKAGGLLATFCCSHHVDASTFLDVILSAAFDVRRVLRRVAVCTQSPDHPVVPSIPETEYLKGYLLEVVR